MTERWVSTKKHYCKYCNTWIPDTKLSRQQHESTDRHKNAMQRNLSRIQKQDLINRHASGQSSAPTAPKATATNSTSMRKSVVNTAAYGYGDRSDMAAYIARGKKMKFDKFPTTEVDLPKRVREANVGKWEVTQIISKEDEKENDDGVKKEESPEAEVVPRTDVGEKRERATTPDVEDLVRFKVQEKIFPTEIKDEEDVKVPVVGFKKRKVGGKSTRVSGAL